MAAMNLMLAYCVLAFTTSLTHARDLSSSRADGGSAVSTFIYPQCQLYLESVEYSETPVLFDVSCTNPRKSFLSLNTTSVGPGCIVAVYADSQCNQPVNTQANGSCVTLSSDDFLGALLAYKIYGCQGGTSSSPVPSNSTGSGTSSSSASSTIESTLSSSSSTSTPSTLWTSISATTLTSNDNVATMSSSPETNAQNSNNNHNGNSASSDRATIAGTVIGSVLGTAALIVTMYFGLVARRRYDRQHKHDHDRSPSSASSIRRSIVR